MLWQLSEALAAEHWALDTSQQTVSMIVPVTSLALCVFCLTLCLVHVLLMDSMTACCFLTNVF